MIDTVKKAYPVALLCEVFEVSRSGYYFWKSREKSARQQEYERLTPVVHMAHKVSKGTYGARRIAEEVAAHGVSCGRAKAATLMKIANVAAKQKKTFAISTFVERLV
jgi:putative transposase